MSTDLSRTELKVIEELKERRVFDKIDGHRIPSEKKCGLFNCRDMERMPDISEHHKKFFGPTQDLSRFGGSLILADGSPVSFTEATQRETLVEIGGGISIKGLEILAVGFHGPCGMARRAGLSIIEMVQVGYAGKLRLKMWLKEHHPKVEVRPFVHIDYSGGKMKTYFFNKKNWEQFCAEKKIKPFFIDSDNKSKSAEIDRSRLNT